jgi:hypothetical protein
MGASGPFLFCAQHYRKTVSAVLLTGGKGERQETAPVCSGNPAGLGAICATELLGERNITHGVEPAGANRPVAVGIWHRLWDGCRGHGHPSAVGRVCATEMGARGVLSTFSLLRRIYDFWIFCIADFGLDRGFAVSTTSLRRSPRGDGARTAPSCEQSENYETSAGDQFAAQSLRVGTGHGSGGSTRKHYCPGEGGGGASDPKRT